MKIKPTATQPDKRHSRSRRRLLQSLAVGTTAITVKSLPEKWAKPALDTTIVPAHAQCTAAATLTCEIDQPFSEQLDGGSILDPVRGVNGPWLTGNSGTGIVEGFNPVPDIINTVTFSFNSIFASVSPPSAGPVTLMVNAGVGDNGGTAVVNQGASQTILPDGSGNVSFDNQGQDVIVEFSSTQIGDANGVESTGPVQFVFSACDQTCTINVLFQEAFHEP